MIDNHYYSYLKDERDERFKTSELNPPCGWELYGANGFGFMTMEIRYPSVRYVLTSTDNGKLNESRHSRARGLFKRKERLHMMVR